jgi:hypothetical protein
MPIEGKMESRTARLAGLAAAVALLFAAGVLLVLRVLPEPHTDRDYLVAGSLGTLLALTLSFVLLLAFTGGLGELLRRKPRPPPEDQAGSA